VFVITRPLRLLAPASSIFGDDVAGCGL